MKSWIEQVPKASGSAQNGNQKGKGKGQDRRVKPRVQQDTLQCVVNAVQAVGDNSLQNSRAIRMLTGLALSTSLVPSDPVLVQAAALEPTPQDPHLTQLYTWAVLVTGLGAHSKVSAQHKQVLATHAANVEKPEDLADKVLFCRVQPTFGDASQFKVQFSVTPDLHGIGVALLAALATIGGVTKFCGPPRSRSERNAAEALKLLNQCSPA
ncbi:unnamed protein product [Polarella glacialis]|uniref:Uncharacterized protein n=1 Tax=Polarella glacialis TaxID=89957 RepID=A0A813JPH1_POLGL|nr:unnamed protein product [Polarella glacialis]